MGEVIVSKRRAKDTRDGFGKQSRRERTHPVDTIIAFCNVQMLYNLHDARLDRFYPETIDETPGYVNPCVPIACLRSQHFQAEAAFPLGSAFLPMCCAQGLGHFASGGMLLADPSHGIPGQRSLPQCVDQECRGCRHFL